MHSSLEKHWNSVKEQIAAEAMHVSRVASTLEQQALQPLQVYMQADLEKRFRGVVQDGRRLIKDYVGAKNMLQKTRDKYYRCVVVVVVWLFVCVCVHVCAHVVMCCGICMCVVCVHVCVLCVRVFVSVSRDNVDITM